jgi:formate C-acetyltransferase
MLSFGRFIMESYYEKVSNLKMRDRIVNLKDKMFEEKRYISIEQAKIITKVYSKNKEQPIIIKRAIALKEALEKMEIRIDKDELIVGNRTFGVRNGVVFPESGISWVKKELNSLPYRNQDKFNVRDEDKSEFIEKIYPFWKGISLEDKIKDEIGYSLKDFEKVVKINQKDHAQGHICPNVENWLKFGLEGIKKKILKKLKSCNKKNIDFYKSTLIVLDGAVNFIKRYSELALKMSLKVSGIKEKEELKRISKICKNISCNPPGDFYEALQSVWFLFVILHMESNASSFSPGRMDQYLYSYLENDIKRGILNYDKALELIECIWIKFNQIVYLRNSNSAKYFAGFPIGFNIAIGGQNSDGIDSTNILSYLFLKAQEHLGLPQPNLSARLHKNSPFDFMKECVKVISKGSGMPQCFNDEAIIPALMNQGISEKDAKDYSIVGCVELTTQGNNLGWSDAAMFNVIKVLELTLNNGKCLLTDEKIGLDTGNLTDYKTFENLESALERQIDFFINKMIKFCEIVEKAHMKVLPSPFLSTVINDCIKKGVDVTSGGAYYNLSGIQIIQGANLADSLAAIKKLVFDEKRIKSIDLLNALKNNYCNNEFIRLTLLNHAPKYGNDIDWVDNIANKWIKYINEKISGYENIRKGPYHTGLYTVSAHVPMGQNVGATSDGRFANEPLADGGMSPVYGRDLKGPTAVLKSVSRVNSLYGSNGTLLNMKFLPEFFQNESGIEKFIQFLKVFVKLNISHIQFNVLGKEDLIGAKKDPEKYRGLTVRVAGYTAYFTELADELQNEIIARTSFGDI